MTVIIATLKVVSTMGLSFRSAHRQASILGAGSYMSNFGTAKPDRAGVAVRVDLPAWVGIEKEATRRQITTGALFY